MSLFSFHYGVSVVLKGKNIILYQTSHVIMTSVWCFDHMIAGGLTVQCYLQCWMWKLLCSTHAVHSWSATLDPITVEAASGFSLNFFSEALRVGSLSSRDLKVFKV